MTAPVSLDERYRERVYAGILGKLIGVYLGRPVEGWPYQEILGRFGQIDHYVNDELDIPLIVADDDISGTLAFARAVEDNNAPALTASQVGDTWLNYIVEDRTILWWGGYGRSTEHTAYLNLKRGLNAPASGSIETNGRTLAEQIGAQIFSDAFALMSPADPALAVHLTRIAASVSHDGAALECAGFFAAMRSAAFIEPDLGQLIQIGADHVTDPRLHALIDDVLDNVTVANDWREVRDWVDSRYGYAYYPGPCHSLSNTAMSLAALVNAADDFRHSIMVAASVGFDTDSNAGTVGCLNGVRLGLAAFANADDLRAPVADRAIVVSSDGGETVTDAARETDRIVASAHALRGATQPAMVRPRFDFHLPGSVHGFTLCPYRSNPEGAAVANLNTKAGVNALTVTAPSAGTVTVSTCTFLDPREAMSNFSTLASPTLYPSQTVRARVSASSTCEVRMYLIFNEESLTIESDITRVGTGEQEIQWQIPDTGNDLPFRLGFSVTATKATRLLIHEVDWTGAPAHFHQGGILLSSIWDTKPAGLAPWVSSARNFEADFASTYSVSHPDELGVVTTGTRDWIDYAVASDLTLSLHDAAGLVARSRGHRRFVAGILSAGTAAIISQRDTERTILAEVPFDYALDTRYHLELACAGNQICLRVDGIELVRATTEHVTGGGAGFLIERGTTSADGFNVRAITDLEPS
jgi:ADP-ribosylglycohydrolase